jgi:hypothetical protein
MGDYGSEELITLKKLVGEFLDLSGWSHIAPENAYLIELYIILSWHCKEDCPRIAEYQNSGVFHY